MQNEKENLIRLIDNFSSRQRYDHARLSEYFAINCDKEEFILFDKIHCTEWTREYTRMRHEQRNSPGRQSDCLAKFHAQKVPNALLRFMSKMAYHKKNRQAEQKPRGQPAQPEPTAMTTPLAAPLSYAASLAEPRGVGGQIASSAHSLLPPPLLLVPLLNVHLSQPAHSTSFGQGTIQCRLRPLL